MGALFASAALLAACASLERLPAAPLDKAREMTFHGIPDARFYPTDSERLARIADQAYARRKAERGLSGSIYFLAISGGADDEHSAPAC